MEPNTIPMEFDEAALCLLRNTEPTLEQAFHAPHLAMLFIRQKGDRQVLYLAEAEAIQA